MPMSSCVDPVVGAILSGWRYDISGLSPAMRTDYENHLEECPYCRSKLRLHRTIDVLLISVFTLFVVTFLLAVAVIRRVEMLSHLGPVHVQLHQFHSTTIAISLEAVAFAGLFFSALLWVLVAIATPLPGFLGGILRKRIDPDRLPATVRERLLKHQA